MTKPTRDSVRDDIQALVSMLRIRAYEHGLIELHRQGKAPGTCTGVGQEAGPVGVISQLLQEDRILTNHRSAGHLIARGAEPMRMYAEVLGRVAGYCQGNGGSLHMSASELGVVLTSTIVGGELSLAPGVALAQRMQRRPGIVACFFGDGAACEGIFHESLNLAATWRLPILYVCENNEWQAFVRRDETMLIERISDRASAYGMAGGSVDGNDLRAVRAAAAAAVHHVRTTGTPYLLETRTYRMRGHFEPDDQAYVDPAERAHWAQRDPLQNLFEQLEQDGSMSRTQFLEFDRMAQEEMNSAVALAQDSPFPGVERLTTDVLA